MFGTYSNLFLSWIHTVFSVLSFSFNLICQLFSCITKKFCILGDFNFLSFFVFSTDNMCCFRNWKRNNKCSQRNLIVFIDWLIYLTAPLSLDTEIVSDFMLYLIFLWWTFLWIKPVLCLLWLPRIIARNAIMEIQDIHILKILNIWQFFFFWRERLRSTL